MSRPRAATSEHTSRRSSFALNFDRVANRSGWLISPCSWPTLNPCRFNDLYRISTSRLRLQKISALVTSSVRIIRRSASRLSRSSTTARPATIVDATLAGRLTVISLGFDRNASASRRISGAIVALKNNVCRDFGKKPTIFSTSGMKPMSSMRSASSITSILVSVSNRPPRSNKSISRPGVAIRTSTPFISASFWSDRLSPPISRAWFSFMYLPYSTKFSATCNANSRVGSRIRLRGIRARAREPDRISISGNTKLAVLPVPVCAQPRTSRPMNTAGIACAWIGVGMR